MWKLNRRRFFAALMAVPGSLFGRKQLPKSGVAIAHAGRERGISIRLAQHYDPVEDRFIWAVCARWEDLSPSLERKVSIVDPDGTRREVKIRVYE